MSALDDKINDLVNSVNVEDTVIDSAIAFINGVPALVQAAKDAALAAGATQDQLESLTNLKTTLDAKSTEMKAALTANTTPSEPPTPTPNPLAAMSFLDDRGSPLTAMHMIAGESETVKIQIDNGTLDQDSLPEWNVESDSIQLFPSSDGLSSEISAQTAGISGVTVKANVGGNAVTGRLPVTVTA